jgi:hypothetical protein
VESQSKVSSLEWDIESGSWTVNLTVEKSLTFLQQAY